MTNPFQEASDSQQPALRLLQKLGWKYITRDQVAKERNVIKSNVLLEHVLEGQLRALNKFEYKGKEYQFSEGNIHAAIHALKNVPDEGLLRTSEKVYDLITLGKSFEETVQGDKKSFTINYIDWVYPENNVYHITEEYEIEGLNETRRPDLVLFVNGIPFVVIENKRRDKNLSLEESVLQFVRNQKKEEGIPKLFYYAQILLAVQPNEVKYATTNTAPKFWSSWTEEGLQEESVKELIESTINNIGGENRLPTEQDRILFALCNISRLMELCYQFIVFDAGEKKITRYQQYFAVKNTLFRIRETNEEGQRRGGVIWHTQGSGKSLTMVMLAKAVALQKNIRNPRVILVTDRIDLDRQIYTTFHHCGKTPARAKSGNHLVELVQDNCIEIITTVIDKFESALTRKDFRNDSSEIFVLVDESHRSQYGTTHAKMRRALPNACYIGFTGTPLLKRDRSTLDRFGGFIDTYPIEKAVKDKAVVPLLYEGRSAKLTVNQGQIDKGFDRLAEPLSEYQRKDLKRKFSSITEIYKSEQVIEEIAYDISKHYCENWKGSGFKAMLAVPRIATALEYLKYFQEQTNPKLKLNVAVVISSSDSREGHEDIEDESGDEVQRFWKKINSRYGSVEAYEESITSRFRTESEEVELLIVVNKLLTGFDAPRATVLYIARPMAEHNLLQAIARVNRLFEGKDFGFIIDYVGILGELDHALTQYSALQEFNEGDLIGTVTNISEEVRKVPQRHAELWDVFKGVENKKDIEALERHLAPKDLRDLFRERFTAFARCMQTALASDEYYKIFNDARIMFFIDELKFFKSLRTSVQVRYAERIDYREYESRVRKLMDTHIGAEGMEQVTAPLNIFDDELFKKEVERITGSTASKADAIAYRMKQVITEKMDEDPVFYKRFSQLIDETIKSFRERRLSEAEYLSKMITTRNEFKDGNLTDIPAILAGKPEARAFYGIVKEALVNGSANAAMYQKIANAGIELSAIVSNLIIRDWQRNEDVQKQMKNDIEDYLLAKCKEWNIQINFNQLDAILDDVMKVARNVF